MRRLLAILLLAFLPFQLSWAAVASYCGHENQVGAGHFGHHDHQHLAGEADGAVLDTEPAAEAPADATAESNDGKAPGAMDLDCGHCHGSCNAMLALPSGLAGPLPTVRPGAPLDAAGNAHAPARPERPQWPPLA